MQQQQGRIVVVGAGPAGLMAAMAAARQGYAVQVFERRPPPSEAARFAARTYPMMLSSR